MAGSAVGSSDDHQYALLIGNGLSIAYNDQLTVASLTDALAAEFRKAGGDEAARALREFAAATSGNDKESFEHLLGPLNHIGEALVSVEGLLPIAKHSDRIREALGVTSEFLSALHQKGLATTLRVIDERARDQGPAFDAVIMHVCAAILKLSETSAKASYSGKRRPVTVGTLNYDGLLHAGFLELGRDVWGREHPTFCDLAAGYGETTTVPYGGRKLTCNPVRASNDLMDDRKIHLVNMHGFIGWLWHPESGKRWKFRLDDLRGDAASGTPSYWDALADGKAEMLPVVVLTDRKGPAVAEAPFGLAYDIFEEKLFWADRWFIGGCALGDEPIQEALLEAAQGRVRKGWEFKLLYAGSPRRTDYAEQRATLAENLGIPEAWITVNFDGFPTVVDSRDWNDWAL